MAAKFLRSSFALILLICPTAHATIFTSQDVFVGGAEGANGTSNYRIPGMTIAPDGSVLAFAEGRRNSGDPGAGGPHIDLVAKRSTDLGATWSDLMVLHSDISFDYSDPRPIADWETGKVHLLYTQWPDSCGQTCVPGGLGSNSSVTFVQTSDDNGLSWSGPLNINSSVKDATWRTLNTGPGSGIQLRWQADPARNGRLLDPAHRDASGYRGVSIFSDDGGATWQHGTATPSPAVDESEVVELTNGDLLWDFRTFSGPTRARFISSNGGETWSFLDNGVIPVTRVDTSMARYSARRDGHDRDRILYLAPLGTPPGSGSGRSSIGVWTSYDEGKSFINPIELASGFAGYSVIQRLGDGTIGALYEASSDQNIRFLRFDLSELEGTEHSSSLLQFDGFGNVVAPLRGGVGWSGVWSNDANVSVQTDEGLEFFSFRIEQPRQHLQFDGATISRSFSADVDLATSNEKFISLFIRRDADASDVGSDEQLELSLLQNQSPRLTFGVSSDEAWFAQGESLDSRVSSSSDDVADDVTYLLLMRLAAPNTPGGNLQLSMAHFTDASTIPDDVADVNWSLTNTDVGVAAGIIDALSIATGESATWRVDELRIGDSYSSVIVDNGLTGVTGDINQDGLVDELDADSMLANWRTAGHVGLAEKITHGDLNLDGLTDLADAFILHRELVLARGFGLSFDRFADHQVPEPSIATLVAISIGIKLLGLRGAVL